MTETFTSLKVPRVSTDGEAMTIRKSLDGQIETIHRTERRERIKAEFGLIYPFSQLAKHIKTTLPLKLFRNRCIRVISIHEYPRFIPDQALLTYKRAMDSKLLKDFSILEPAYMENVRVYNDPWLVGWLGMGPEVWNYEARGNTHEPLVVLAYWD